MGPSQRAIIRTVAGPVRAGAGPGAAARRRARGGRGAAAQPAARASCPGSPGWPPRRATSRAAPTPRRAATGTTSSRSTTTASRSRSATSSGTGPAAAAVMGQLRSALAAYLLDGHGPAAALERLDRFAARIPGAQGSTCVCLTLDWLSGELRYARAGHLPVLLRRARRRPLRRGGRRAPCSPWSGRPSFVEGSATITAGHAPCCSTPTGWSNAATRSSTKGSRAWPPRPARHRDADPDELADAGGRRRARRHRPARRRRARRGAARARAAGRHAARRSPRRCALLRRAITAWATAAGLPDAAVDDLQLAAGRGRRQRRRARLPRHAGHVRRHAAADGVRRDRGAGARPRPVAARPGRPRLPGPRPAGDPGDRA